MTKSEARAIEESMNRALQKIEGPGPMPWVELGEDLKMRIYTALREATDEIRRVRDMATAELG